jgi:DNA-binding CsgD family transcriptional regulator/PAS domain-containing protein
MSNNYLEVFQRLLSEISSKVNATKYDVFEKHRLALETLSTFQNSSISVFDLSKAKHIFYSNNFYEILGYSKNSVESLGQNFFDAKIHTSDHIEITANAISMLKLFLNFSTEDKLNNKFVSEYRILNSTGQYIRIIEQQQILELDENGQVWLAMSTVDISPNQNNFEGVNCQLLNFKTGKIMAFYNDLNAISVQLSSRELEVLKLVKEGFLSKEISGKLSISVHTVNTHRQRFLEKLGANNSIEAVEFASRLGLLN